MNNMKDDGIRLLNVEDLIETQEKVVEDETIDERDRETSRLMVEWLKSDLDDFGVMMNPYKRAVLRQYNILMGREEDPRIALKLLREKNIEKKEYVK